MNKHKKFLQFNGTNLVFIQADGQYVIALRPILKALNLPERRYLQKTSRDPFFKGCLLTMSMQVPQNGRIQARNMTCLPEKFIYGWICFLNSDDSSLLEYKRTCYELLFNHFRGTITMRKELVLERMELEKEIKEMEEAAEAVKQLAALRAKKRSIDKALKLQDEQLVKQQTLSFE